MSADGKRPCRDLTALESSLADRVVKLEAERDELREALRLVAEVARNASHGALNPASAVEPIYKAAHAALAKPRA